MEIFNINNVFPSFLVLSVAVTSKMKVALCLFACLSVALAFPQKEGAAFSNDAIRQAQTSSLIPQDAKIENVRTFTADLEIIS